MIGSVDDQERAARRGQAIRALLANPLLDRTAAPFAAVAVEAEWLTQWFANACGWPLSVDSRRGFARLRKISAWTDMTRPLTSQRTKNPPFNARRYVLFCLLAAALGEHQRSRISLRELAEGVCDLAVRADVATYDPTDTAERRALIDALLALSRYGVIIERDRAGKDYVQDATTNVLYEVDERRLANLIAAPVPPSRCATWRQMTGEDNDSRHQLAGGSNGSRSSAENRRAVRHRVMRRLLDDPVCHLDDLDEAELACLRTERVQIEGDLTDAGLILERRAEAWIAVDREQTSTQRTFPNATIPAQAALLLLDQVLQSQSGEWLSQDRAEDAIEELLAAHPRWAKGFRGDGGTRHLVRNVTTLLNDFGLVHGQDGDWTVRPSAWRWSVDLQPDEDPEHQDAAPLPSQGELFPVEET
jgi:uncharacterized protein (TIGR02678 family)